MTSLSSFCDRLGDALMTIAALELRGVVTPSEVEMSLPFDEGAVLLNVIMLLRERAEGQRGQ